MDFTQQVIDKLTLFVQKKTFTVECKPGWNYVFIVFENNQEKFSMQQSFGGGYHWVHIMIPNEDKISVSDSSLSIGLYTQTKSLYKTLCDTYEKQELVEKEKNEQKLKEAHQAYLSAEHKKQTQILNKLDAYLK